MSPMPDTMPRRTRRSFTDDFKAGAIRVVLDEGQTVAAVARDLGLTESSLRNWVEQARADRTKGKDGPDDRRTRGVGAPAQRESRAPRGARHPKKSRGLLREAESMRFAFMAVERASMRLPSCAGVCRSRRVAITPGSAAQNRSGPGRTVD